jgi:NAD(P)H-nitrite reductase large subunit
MHIVIIGNGVAGITAARHIRKRSDYRITVISSESKYFFSRTALMYIYMGHLTLKQTEPYEDWFWEKNRIDLLADRVEAVETANKTLRLASGGTLRYDKLLIASGSRPRMFGWKGQELGGVQGFYSLQDLQTMIHATARSKRAVVVGGGLIGVEVAEMLHSRKIHVTFLAREARYWGNVLPDAESEMVSAHIREHEGVDLRLNTELREILPDSAGRARAVVTSADEEIPCDFVALTVGVEPNIDFARSSGIEIGRGILVNDCFETSTPDVYAVGDCAEIVQTDASGAQSSRVEQLWYAARAHGECVAKTICGEPSPYRRDVFFNSAKFFDLEYQTYGDVSARPKSGEASALWKDDAAKRLVRIVYADDETRRVLGFNLLGVRYRQEVCSEWIRRGESLQSVVENLEKANFDPEFTAAHEPFVREILR